MRLGPIVILLIAAAAAGCSPLGVHTFRTTTQSPPAMRHVTWPEAQRLIRTCEATMVGQAHSLDVVLTLRDGRRIATREPTIDDIADEAFRVSGKKCPLIAYATE